MKKALISIFLVTFIIMSSSCTANHILKPNELYFADATASVFGEGKNDAKIDLTGRTVFVSDNYNETQQYVTVSIDGKEYTGKLGSVFLSPFFEDDRLIYECETDNGFLEISVNKSHGDFVGYRFITTETGEETFEKCRDAAMPPCKNQDLTEHIYTMLFAKEAAGNQTWVVNIIFTTAKSSMVSLQMKW